MIISIQKYSFFLRAGPSYSVSLNVLNNQNYEQFYLTVHRHFCKINNTRIPNNETGSPECAIKTKEAFSITRCRNPWIKSNRAHAGKWDQKCYDPPSPCLLWEGIGTACERGLGYGHFCLENGSFGHGTHII